MNPNYWTEAREFLRERFPFYSRKQFEGHIRSSRDFTEAYVNALGEEAARGLKPPRTMIIPKITDNYLADELENLQIFYIWNGQLKETKKKEETAFDQAVKYFNIRSDYTLKELQEAFQSHPKKETEEARGNYNILNDLAFPDFG